MIREPIGVALINITSIINIVVNKIIISYVKLCMFSGWYYMPSNVHIFPVHGAEIINPVNAISIVKLTEKASKARNKDL